MQTIIISVITASLLLNTTCFKPRYGFTEEDITLLTQLLCGDALISGDGEYDFDHQTVINDREVWKVLNVVMNRQRSNLYPDTVREVVLQSGQFVVFPQNLYTTPDSKAREYISMWCYAYDRYEDIQIIPTYHLAFSAGPGLTNITRRI